MLPRSLHDGFSHIFILVQIPHTPRINKDVDGKSKRSRKNNRKWKRRRRGRIRMKREKKEEKPCVQKQKVVIYLTVCYTNGPKFWLLKHNMYEKCFCNGVSVCVHVNFVKFMPIYWLLPVFIICIQIPFYRTGFFQRKMKKEKIKK